MPELEIIGSPLSNFVWVVRIACGEKGVPYTLTPAMPRTPEVQAIHPLGKIPAMRHGDVVLAESKAICTYIDQTFPGPRIIPENPRLAALTEQWVSIINTAIDPVVVRRYLGAYFFPKTPDGSPDRATIAEVLPTMESHLSLLDRAVASGHLVGSAFTLADADLVPILYYLNKLPESAAMIAARPALTAYLARHLERPSVRDTVPPPMPPRDPA